MSGRVSNELDSTDDDDEALWIVPGRDSLPEPASLPAVSPWRVPSVLRNYRDVRTKALLRAARGPLLFGLLELKVLFWVLSYVVVPLLLLYVDEDFFHICSVAVGFSPAKGHESTPKPSIEAAHSGSGRKGNGQVLQGPESTARVQVLALLGLTATALGLFGSLYGSDPGWIKGSGHPAVDLDLHPGRTPCLHCGEVPSLRSHHDKHTGQCVHKHDHHCCFLNATIGDRNHARFVALLLLDLALLTWLQLRVLPLVLRCGSMQWRWLWAAQHTSTGRQLSCLQAHGWGWVAALWVLVLFGTAMLALVVHLSLLHLYLAATNQTTLELLKGPRLPYLSRAYAALPPSRLGPEGNPPTLLGSSGEVSLTQIVRKHWRGTAPPRPFDEGMWRNLWIFLLAPKPYPYRYQQSRADSVSREVCSFV